MYSCNSLKFETRVYSKKLLGKWLKVKWMTELQDKRKDYLLGVNAIFVINGTHLYEIVGSILFSLTYIVFEWFQHWILVWQLPVWKRELYLNHSKSLLETAIFGESIYVSMSYHESVEPRKEAKLKLVQLMTLNSVKV